MPTPLLLRTRLRALALTAALAAPALAQPSDTSIERALDRNDVVYTAEANGDYRMLYQVGEKGRSHLVWVRPETFQVGSVDVREVYAYAMELDASPLPAGVAERLLRYNDDYIQGAWARSDDRLIFSARIPADASDEVLIDTISLVLNTADAVEEELTGKDDW